MAKNSNIEWTHHTFNPWRGCTKVSEGCKNCYAMVLSDRYQGRHGVWGPKGTRIVASESMWREPLKWNREAEQEGERKRVFCCSLADVFEDWQGPMSSGKKGAEGKPILADPSRLNDPHSHYNPHLDMDDCRDRLWDLIEATPMLDWLLLTKRPENVNRMIPPRWVEGLPGNIWVGTSAENQKVLDERIEHLCQIKASVLFLSLEPLLAGIELCTWLAAGARVGWVIVGGESGPGARPFDPQDAHSLMMQCEKYNVPFFMKQMGSKPYDKFNDQPVKILDPKGHDWMGYDALRKREFPA